VGSQAAEFRRRCRVLRYDTRGHGQSSSTSGAYSIEQLAKDVIALLDALDLGRVHFCGLSMGGMIGMWLGANAPERWIILSSATLRTIELEKPWNARIEAVQKNGMKSISSAVIERWLRVLRQKAPEAISSTLKMIEEANPEGYAACAQAVRDLRFPRTIKNHSCTGVGDRRRARSGYTACGRALSRRSVPGARYAELNAAHLSNIEDQDRSTEK